MRRIGVFLLLAGLVAAGRPAWAAPSRVRGVANAEDLAPTPDGRWVFAGSGPGGPVRSGWLARVDAASGKARKVYPPGAGRAAPETPGCAAEVSAGSFAPHGIALSPAGDTLYVVNHGERESIEIFRVTSARQPGLRWIGCVLAPPGFYQNAVAVSADGALFVTMWPLPLDMKTFTGMAGKIFAWSPSNGWRAVAQADVVTPNGILVTPDGKTIYVDAYARREVVELSLDGAAVGRRTLELSFMPDNLRWGRDGSLLVAGQRATFPQIARCAGSASAECQIPSAIALIDRSSFQVRCERAVDLSFATTAAPVGREVWVSHYRGRAILRLGGDAFAAPNCERPPAAPRLKGSR